MRRILASVDLRNSIRSSSASVRLRTLPHLRGLAGNLRCHQASSQLFSVGAVIQASPAPRNAGQPYGHAAEARSQG
jgi:hypothetical protein